MKYALLGAGCLLLTGLSWQAGAYDEDDLKTLKATNQCFRCDLSGANLTEENLTKAFLTNAILTGANLTGAKLGMANLVGAYLVRARLIGAKLTKANLEGANLFRAYLEGANLVKAKLTGAKLKMANLTDANLTGADLTKANLTAAKFCNTKMPDGTINNSGCDSVAKKDAPKPTSSDEDTPSVGVTWCLDSQTIELANKAECQTRGGLTFASKFLAEKACKECKDRRLTTSKEMVWCATESDVSYVSEKECDEKNGVGNTVKSYAEAMHRGFKRDATKKDDLKKLLETKECKKCDLEGANLKGARLPAANLEGAVLEGAILGAAYLGGANLKGANLKGANLKRAILGGANLKGANLKGANMYKANLKRATLEGANLAGAKLNGAFLIEAKLNGANLTGANLKGAFLRLANLTDANLTGADLTKANGTGAKFCNTKMPDGTINNSGCDSVAKKDAPKPAPTPASSGKTWCGMHDSTEYLTVSDCFSRNGIPTASRSQSGRLKNDYFAKKNHKAYAKANDTAAWSSRSVNTLEAKKGALTHCHGISKQPSTCRIVNVNGQYVDEAPVPVSDSLNVSSDYRLSDLVGRYSMTFKEINEFDGFIALKVSGGGLSRRWNFAMTSQTVPNTNKPSLQTRSVAW